MPPLSEDSLIHYATYCHKHLNLKCSTIKLYICGICHKYLTSGTPNIFSNCCSSKMFRLEAIYRGTRRGIKKSETKIVRERLPITYDILLDMCQLLHKQIFLLTQTYSLKQLILVSYDVKNLPLTLISTKSVISVSQTLDSLMIELFYI